MPILCCFFPDVSTVLRVCLPNSRISKANYSKTANQSYVRSFKVTDRKIEFLMDIIKKGKEYILITLTINYSIIGSIKEKPYAVIH